MKIAEKLPSTSNSLFYDQDFRAVLESHLNWLRSHETTRSMVVAANDAYRFGGDFYRYLYSLGSINRAYFWVIMRLNDMVSPNQFDTSIESILIPSIETLEKIRKTHVTYHNI